MAIRKIIWVSGMPAPTYVVDLQNPGGQTFAGPVVAGDYINAKFNMITNVNAYLFMDLSNVTDYTIQADDYLEYDIYWETTGNIKIAIDIAVAGGIRNLRDSSVTDQNGFLAAPSTDLSSKATGLWYHRKISIIALSDGAAIGATLALWDIACENDTTGEYVAWFKNIVITDGAETTSTSTSSTSSSTSTSSTSSSISTSSTSSSTTSTSISTSSTSVSTTTALPSQLKATIKTVGQTVAISPQ